VRLFAVNLWPYIFAMKLSSKVNNKKNNNKLCCGIVLCFSVKNDISKFSFYTNEISFINFIYCI